MKKLILFLVSIATCWLAMTEKVQAKDLTSRLGVGYSNQFSEDLPSLGVRYYPNPQLGISGALGVDTDEDKSKFGFMVRIFKIIFPEDNLNFYMGSGAGLISEKIKGSDNQSGFELTGFAGCEFFFTGLDSLGFSFEAGIGVTSISSQVRFRTMGDFVSRAGMHFYF